MPINNFLRHQSVPEDPDRGVPYAFRGFTIQVKADERQRVWELIAEKLKFLELDSQSHRQYSFNDLDLIEVTIIRELSAAKAWELTYHLRQLPGVLYAEPRFALINPTTGGICIIRQPTRNSTALHTQPRRITDDRTDDPEWSLDQMKIKDAWKEFFKDRQPGEGIVIGHPDIGYLRHPELDQVLKLEEVREPFSEGDRGEPVSEINGNLPPIFWHGTSTASLIVSPEGLQIKGTQGKFVTGVAPGARLKPLRIQCYSPSFEIFSPNLASAINYAVEQNVHIISISLGGYPSLSVHRAIINAQKKGIIVVAAAGNTVPFAVWPAAYDKVVAVASSTADRTIAEHSSRGSRVNIAAPGELVWCATARQKNGELVSTVTQQSGTSFATALVAGVAALWLSRWGWDYLRDQYGAERIPLVFDKLLRDTCDKSDNWDTANWGVGIVNAYKLLSAEVPDKRDSTKTIPLDIDEPAIQVPLAFLEVDHVQLDRGGIETFAHLFEQTLLEIAKATPQDTSPSSQVDIVQRLLSKLLGKSGKELRMYLRTFGQELTFHFGVNFSLYELMENALKLEAGLETDSTKNNVDTVRDELRKHVSKYLEEQLLLATTPT